MATLLDPLNWPEAGKLTFYGAIAVLVAIGIAMTFRTRRAHIAIGIIVSVLLIAGVLAYGAGSTRRLVEAELESTCSDGMWLGHVATCHPAAADYLTTNFYAFDPNKHHSWDELSDVRWESIAGIGANAINLGGHATASVGRVLAVQDVGSTLIVQLAGLTDADRAKLIGSSAADALIPHDALDQVSAPVSADSWTSAQRVYCNLPPRPFFSPAPGDLLIFNGTLAATGIIPQLPGNENNQTAYVYCSSAEVVRAQVTAG